MFEELHQRDSEMTPETTYWKSIYHQERFLVAVPKIGKTWPEQRGQFDTEYATALYILTADSGTWNKAEDYVERDGIDFEKMLEEINFSGGYARLIKLAWHLFNEQGSLLPIELLHLDDANFRLALEALKIRRYGFSPTKQEKRTM
ncbi:MAG: hypothetical protein ACRDHZ_00080 [Ktedonobacteraceae bacterium]